MSFDIHVIYRLLISINNTHYNIIPFYLSFTFFQPDERKQGGAYRTITGKVKKIDEYEHRILLEDGTALMVEHLVSIEGNPGM